MGFLGLASFLHVAPSLAKAAWAGRGVVLVPGKVPGFASLRLSVEFAIPAVLLPTCSHSSSTHPPIYLPIQHASMHPPTIMHPSIQLLTLIIYSLTRCLLIFLPTLLGYPSANTSDFSSVHPSRHPYIHACLYTFMQAHIYPSLCPLTYLCIYPCIHVSIIYSFIHPSVYQSTSLIIKATYGSKFNFSLWFQNDKSPWEGGMAAKSRRGGRRRKLRDQIFYHRRKSKSRLEVR